MIALSCPAGGGHPRDAHLPRNSLVECRKIGTVLCPGASPDSFSENAAVIQAGSEGIRSSADDLARRTEQQTASLEETAALGGPGYLI